MDLGVMNGNVARNRGKNSIAGLIAVCVLLMLTAIPARAASRFSAEDLATCKALSEHSAELIRAGQSVITTRKQLRRCVRILRAEKQRAARAAAAARN